MSSTCRSYKCNNPAQVTCSKCKIVKYCTYECMVGDLPGHSILCRESYPDMLRAYSEYLQTCKLPEATISYQIIKKLIKKDIQ